MNAIGKWIKKYLLRRWSKKQRFASRSPLTAQTLYERYYAPEGYRQDDIIWLWNIIAHHLDIDGRQLRPTDRFDKELSPESGTELIDEIEDLTAFVRVEAAERRKSFRAEDLKSIDDVMRLLAKKHSK